LAKRRLLKRTRAHTASASRFAAAIRSASFACGTRTRVSQICASLSLRAPTSHAFFLSSHVFFFSSRAFCATSAMWAISSAYDVCVEQKTISAVNFMVTSAHARTRTGASKPNTCIHKHIHAEAAHTHRPNQCTQQTYIHNGVTRKQRSDETVTAEITGPASHRFRGGSLPCVPPPSRPASPTSSVSPSMNVRRHKTTSNVHSRAHAPMPWQPPHGPSPTQCPSH
jgi:hypothetical protein